MKKRLRVMGAVLSCLCGCGPEPDTSPSFDFDADTDLFGPQGLEPLADPGGPGSPGACRRIITHGGRYLDAYTGGNGDVVTRPSQSGDTQRWCFNLLSSTDWIYTIRHRHINGEFLDAYESLNDHKAVLRSSFQSDGSQYWQRTESAVPTDRFQLIQVSTGRALEVLTTSADDYRAVTRTPSTTAVNQSFRFQHN